MAEDVICLLDTLGWTGTRELHVVGISLGGMIAQGRYSSSAFLFLINTRTELASRIPQRIASLTLAVTTPGGRPWNNFPPVRAALEQKENVLTERQWAGLKTLTRLVFIADPAKKVPLVMDMLYPAKWLAEHDEDDPQGRTNRDVQSEVRLIPSKPLELYISELNTPHAVIPPSCPDHQTPRTNGPHLPNGRSANAPRPTRATGGDIKINSKGGDNNGG